MTIRILTTTSFLALTAFATTPALADVTAEEVWESWKVLATVYGQSYVAETEVRSGDTLTLTNVALAAANGDLSLTGNIPEIAFRETGDGKVDITMSEEYSMAMRDADEDSKISMVLTIAQPGLVMTASGTPEAINYDMAGDTLTVSLSDFIIDDQPRALDVDLIVAKPAITYEVTPGEVTGITSTFASEGLAFTFAGEGEGGQGSFEGTGQMNNLAGASAGGVPKGVVMDDMAKMLAAGYTTQGSFTYDSGNFALDAVDPDGSTTSVSSQSKGGNLNFSLDKDRISYGLIGKSVAMTASGSAIPFPEVAVAYDEAAFSLLVPVSKSDEAKDFALQTRIQGLTVSDMIWAMFDPASTLPRDPATLIVALKGKAKPLMDLLSGDETTMTDAPPFEMEALDVEALQLTVAGAEFKGNGALAFDNTQPPTLGGMAPMPTGKLNLTLTGANTLLDKLEALGLVGSDIGMTFGMFAAMIAKPGPTPDSFVAEVEFKEDGQILTNGNPLPF
jgi:hypothetical protein